MQTRSVHALECRNKVVNYDKVQGLVVVRDKRRLIRLDCHVEAVNRLRMHLLLHHANPDVYPAFEVVRFAGDDFSVEFDGGLVLLFETGLEGALEKVVNTWIFTVHALVRKELGGGPGGHLG